MKGGLLGGGADQLMMEIRWWRKFDGVVEWGFRIDLEEGEGGGSYLLFVGRG